MTWMPLYKYVPCPTRASRLFTWTFITHVNNRRGFSSIPSHHSDRRTRIIHPHHRHVYISNNTFTYTLLLFFYTNPRLSNGVLTPQIRDHPESGQSSRTDIAPSRFTPCEFTRSTTPIYHFLLHFARPDIKTIPPSQCRQPFAKYQPCCSAPNIHERLRTDSSFTKHAHFNPMPLHNTEIRSKQKWFFNKKFFD